MSCQLARTLLPSPCVAIPSANIGCLSIYFPVIRAHGVSSKPRKEPGEAESDGADQFSSLRRTIDCFSN